MCFSTVFQQFMNLHRGSGDMLRWITRFQLSIQRMQEAWNDTYLPILDVNNAEVRAFITGLPAEEQATITPEEAMERANERLREQHARTIPITADLVALIFVSLSDLTQGSATSVDIFDGTSEPRARRLPPQRASGSVPRRSFVQQKLPSTILSSLPPVMVAGRPS